MTSTKPLLWGDMTDATPLAGAGSAASGSSSAGAATETKVETKTDKAVDDVTKKLADAKVETPDDDSGLSQIVLAICVVCWALRPSCPPDAAKMSGHSGLHPHDHDAKVEVEGLSKEKESIYKAVATFEELGLYVDSAHAPAPALVPCVSPRIRIASPAQLHNAAQRHLRNEVHKAVQNPGAVAADCAGQRVRADLCNAACFVCCRRDIDTLERFACSEHCAAELIVVSAGTPTSLGRRTTARAKPLPTRLLCSAAATKTNSSRRCNSFLRRSRGSSRALNSD